jgi:hypothetical protein
MNQFFGRTFLYSIGLMLGLLVLAAIAYSTGLSIWILFVLTLVVTAITSRHLDLGIYLMFIELFSNPHGGLISAPISGFTFSLRMAVFTGVMLGWVIGMATKRYAINIRDHRLKLFALLALAALWGMITGALSQDIRQVFADGNAYLYLLYLLPIVSVRWDEIKKHNLIQILAAGGIWIALVSLGLLYTFTHFGNNILTPAYSFFRDVRMAEITLLEGGVYRVFIQSQLFSMVFGFFLLTSLGAKIKKQYIIGIAAIILSVIVLAFSRSFWVGLMPTLLFLLGTLIYTHRPTIKQYIRFSATSIGAIIASVILLFVVVLFPLPNKDVAGLALFDSLKGRTTESSDAAVSSRWNLLTPMVGDILKQPIWGYGFGKEVTFQTDDPRARAINPDGTWTTYAMEWGWLELWLKMGILGPIAFIYAGYGLFKDLWNYMGSKQSWLGAALIGGLIFIFATHIFSPYLNHPIGLGYMLFLIPFLSIKKQPESISAVSFSKVESINIASPVVTSDAS